MVSAKQPEPVLPFTPACTPLRAPISLVSRSLPALPSVYAASAACCPAAPQRDSGLPVNGCDARLCFIAAVDNARSTDRCVGPVLREPGVTSGDAASLAAGSQGLVIDARGCDASNRCSSRYAALVQPKPTTFWV